MRTSVAGPIAAHMQRQAILSRHEDTREALAQIGARGGVAARFREVAFPMASVKEHQSRTETFARVSHLVVSVVDDDPQPFPRRRDYASITRPRWTVTGPGSRLFSADLWRRRSPMAPSDSQPAATILQTESSRRSTASDEKCHPRPRHRSAA